MISVAEAKQKIIQNSFPINPKFIKLEDAVGYYLAEDLFAKADIPAFNQAAMDGYAYCFDPHNLTEKYTSIATITAGDDMNLHLAQGHCFRIYTGAAVPNSANTVIMQEKTLQVNQQIQMLDDSIFIGKNIRLKGSELKKGDLLLQKNCFLNAAAIGLLASAGITHLPVFPKPKIAIITTGNELIVPGIDLKKGQVFEANSFVLKSALKQMHLLTEWHLHVADNLAATIQAIKTALDMADIILITGGISVGDFDYVKEAIIACHINPVFHKVSQKPGKPLFYGIKNNQQIFGIPGNPAAVLTCFYEYVSIAINKLIGNPYDALPTIQRPITEKYRKKKGLAHFLKGFYNDSEVRILEAQESYRLSSFARANCLIYMSEDITEINKNEIVTVHLIPNA